MAKHIILAVSNNEGYSADQVGSTMTLRALRDAIDEALREVDEETPIVTKDENNSYGARYGAISIYADTFTVEDDEDEDE